MTDTGSTDFSFYSKDALIGCPFHPLLNWSPQSAPLVQTCVCNEFQSDIAPGTLIT